MGKEDRFYDLRSELESNLAEFKKICEEEGRDFDDEVEDIISCVKK